jgi:hypothetical protein
LPSDAPRPIVVTLEARPPAVVEPPPPPPAQIERSTIKRKLDKATGAGTAAADASASTQRHRRRPC